jgi:site-specific recombinase XerD
MSAPTAPRRRRLLPDFLREDELTALFDAALKAWKQTPMYRTGYMRKRQRDWVMIQACYYFGLRVAELCRQRVEDVDLAEGLLFVRRGKGDADGSVPLPKKFRPVLAEWIGERTSGTLFGGPHGRMSTRHFATKLKVLAQRAGIRRRVFPHILRHSFATHLLRKGATIYEVQRMMRHRDIKTTSIYLHLIPGRLGEVADLL